MKIQIDLKSTLCGLILGVSAMFLMGAGEPQKQIGRYQISSGQGAVAIVDTMTGAVWACEGPGGRQYYPPGGKSSFWDTK